MDSKYISIDWSKPGSADKTAVVIFRKIKGIHHVVLATELLSNPNQLKSEDRFTELYVYIKENLPVDTIYCEDKELLKMLKKALGDHFE